MPNTKGDMFPVKHIALFIIPVHYVSRETLFNLFVFHGKHILYRAKNTAPLCFTGNIAALFTYL